MTTPSKRSLEMADKVWPKILKGWFDSCTTKVSAEDLLLPLAHALDNEYKQGWDDRGKQDELACLSVAEEKAIKEVKLDIPS